MPPVKNPCDFLRRHYPHQVIGSKFGYFLSACTYKLPCIYSALYFTLVSVKMQEFSEDGAVIWEVCVTNKTVLTNRCTIDLQ